jgi:hypothetical protein
MDWKTEWTLFKRVMLYYIRLGLIAIPFGIIYGFAHRALGHPSKLALIVCLVGAIFCNQLIQGFPPRE